MNEEINLNNYVVLRKEVDMGCGWEDKHLFCNENDFRDAVIVTTCLIVGFLLLLISWIVRILK